MSTDAFEQLIDVAAPGGGSYPVQRGHRRGVRSPHTCDAARWPPSSLASPYAPQRSTTAVLRTMPRGAYRPRVSGFLTCSCGTTAEPELAGDGAMGALRTMVSCAHRSLKPARNASPA